MSDNKKYYYLKFKETYFQQDHVKVIEAMENGYIYSLIILKLYLKSLKFHGQLRINEAIPYQADKIDILSKVINHDSDHVMHAINVAKDLGIIEILDTGDIWMADIQNFIGEDSTEAERKRIYRQNLKLIEKGGQTSDDRPPEKEIESEIKLKKEINIIKDKWNIFASENNLSLIDKLTKDRIKKIKLRVKEGLNFDDLLDNIKKQQFLLGNNDRGWTVNFDWIFKNEGNWIKIKENKYKRNNNQFQSKDGSKEWLKTPR